MTARRHHPSCAAADGGNCTNCPQWPPMPVGRPVHQSDITCDECGETYIVAGETPEVRALALATWAGCCNKVTPALQEVADAPPVVRPRLADALRRHPESSARPEDAQDQTPRPDGDQSVGETVRAWAPAAEWAIGRRVVPASSIGPGRAPGSWSLPVERPRRPGPVSRFLRYLAIGRLATWPFDPEDFTT